MKNALDIKREEQLNIILPKKFQMPGLDFAATRCAVLIHLYYEDTIDEYWNYIKNIPSEVDLYFTYSDEQVKGKIELYCTQDRGSENYFFVRKENRGRDISAFLVAARDILLSYDYICFVHDKKEKNPSRKNDTDKWVYSLWENMLGSTNYIKNIVYTFVSKNNIGLLVPPLLITDKIAHAYTNQWGKNFNLTVDLARRLRLKCEIDREKTPLTLGTVFWAKTDALRKLLQKNWRYEEFDDEPLSIDGTISHAVERILAYVAQDAGYDTGWVMTDEYASEYIGTMQETLEKTSAALYENLGLRYVAEIESYKDECRRLEDFSKDKKDIYIYGAGEVGITCYKLLKNHGISVKKFIVTKKSDAVVSVCRLPVEEIKEQEVKREVGIIVAVSSLYVNELLEELSRKGFYKEQVMVFNRWKE